MRLTLRTMLAYLDDVLSESDAEELGNKIERSDFATGLVHKIRNSIGRLRLSSPEVLGHDLMDDPNTVAEFIDSELPPDKEQDFEKVCLQSDKHLAEVASCHQILALVLGTPARVEPRLRERIYRNASSGTKAADRNLGNGERSEQFRRVDQATGLTGDADAEVIPRSRSASDSPAAPISSRHSLWPIAIAVLVGFLLTAGMVIAMGPLNGEHPLANLFGWGADGEIVAQNEPPVEAAPTGRDAAAPIQTNETQQPVDVPSISSEPANHGTLDNTVLDRQTPWPQEPANDSSSGTVEPRVDTPLAANQFPPDDETFAEFPEFDDVIADGASAQPAGDADAIVTPDNPESVQATEAASTPVEAGDANEQQYATVNPDVPEDVGRFLSENEVIVFWDEQSGWMRLPTRAALVVGQRLRSLPTYRPQLLLAQSNVQVAIRGRGELTFDTPIDDSQTPVLLLPYGQLLMNSIGSGISRVAVRSGERLLVIEFAERDTEIAIQTQQVLLPGSDPQSEPPHNLVQIWVTRGIAKIDEGGTTQDVAAGNQYALADDHAAQLTVFTELPVWVFGRIDQVDRDAAAELETLLPVGRDLTLSLNENAEHRRTDVRSLSTRCLVALDDFEKGAAIFSEADKKYQFAWPALFDEFQAAIARGPQTAEMVFETFEKLYGSDAGELYRMLMGYTNEQLATGVAAELVDSLDNDRVEFRILASENIKRLTGKTYLYAPTQSEKLRQSKVARWRAELRNGKVIVREVPASLSDWQRLTAPNF